MAANIVQVEANRLLDASLGTATYTAPTGPMKLALMTANATSTAAGTEVTGGSYARQTIACSAAATGATSNSGTITFTGMPACTVTGINIYDSAGTPRRAWWGALDTSRTLLAGDSLTFNAGAIAITMT